jgi:hypothetical protein
MTVANFFAKMKGFFSELATVGKPVEKDEMVCYILMDLTAPTVLLCPPSTRTSTTLDVLFGQICAHDMR